MGMKTSGRKGRLKWTWQENGLPTVLKALGFSWRGLTDSMVGVVGTGGVAKGPETKTYGGW